MMAVSMQNTGELRSLSQIFSPSNFNKVVRENDFKLTERKVKKYFPRRKATTYKTTLQLLYTQLQNEYCSEYFFKNNLFNEYFLEKYSLKTTTVFNEFKIGSSIADFVLLNGNAKVYEIKTDLDGLDKLKKQLNDYKQFADLVYVVTSSKYVNKILTEYSDTTIGVIEFTSLNTFKEHKKAKSDSSQFNYITIFKTLRKSEYLEITNELFGLTPNVPNTKIFRECLKLISTVDVIDFQRLAFNKIKKRKIKCPELLLSKKTPVELKQICYTLDFTKQEYGTLYKFLNKLV